MRMCSRCSGTNNVTFVRWKLGDNKSEGYLCEECSDMTFKKVKEEATGVPCEICNETGTRVFIAGIQRRLCNKCSDLLNVANTHSQDILKVTT